jgi:hypothetical protein
MWILAASGLEKIPDLRPPKSAVPVEHGIGPWLLIAGCLLVLAFVLVGIRLWRRRRLASEPEPLPETIALGLLGNLIGRESPSAGLAVARILRLFLQSILALEPRERTAPELLQAVRSQSRLDPESLALLSDLLRDCDWTEYSKTSVANSAPGLVDRAIALVGQIADQYRPPTAPKNAGAEVPAP